MSRQTKARARLGFVVRLGFVNRRLFPVAIVAALGLLAATASAQTENRYVRTAAGEKPKPVVAIKNVCAWPNLTVLRDGAIIATIFNQPSHGQLAGDVDCWASTDCRRPSR